MSHLSCPGAFGNTLFIHFILHLTTTAFLLFEKNPGSAMSPVQALICLYSSFLISSEVENCPVQLSRYKVQTMRSAW